MMSAHRRQSKDPRRDQIEEQLFSRKASSHSSEALLTAERLREKEKLLHFLSIGTKRNERENTDVTSNSAEFERFKKTKKLHMQRSKNSFVRKVLMSTRGNVAQKCVLFGPIVWFVIALFFLVRFKHRKEVSELEEYGGGFTRIAAMNGDRENSNDDDDHLDDDDVVVLGDDDSLESSSSTVRAKDVDATKCLNDGFYRTDADECVCRGGWKGARCDEAVCETVNCVHGKCTKPDVCTCFPGYSTFDCSKDFVRDEAGMLLENLKVRVHAKTIALSKKDPEEDIKLIERWSSSYTASSSSSSSSSSESEVSGPWLATGDALGDKVIKSEEHPQSRQFHSCAIVGNSPHLSKIDGLSDVIDEHEAVFRFDGAPTTGKYANIVGTKTTVRILSDMFLETALKNPSRYTKLFTSANGLSSSGSWMTKGVLWEPKSVSKLRQARRAFPELDIQFVSPEILYPAKTIFNEIYNRLNTETKEHIETFLFADEDRDVQSSSFFSSSSLKKKSSESSSAEHGLKPALSSAFFSAFLALQMCTNVNVYGIDAPESYENSSTASYYDKISAGDGLGVSKASKTFETILLRLFHARRLVVSCAGLVHAQKCVSFTPRNHKGVVAHRAVHW